MYVVRRSYKESLCARRREAPVCIHASQTTKENKQDEKRARHGKAGLENFDIRARVRVHAVCIVDSCIYFESKWENYGKYCMVRGFCIFFFRREFAERCSRSNTRMHL